MKDSARDRNIFPIPRWVRKRLWLIRRARKIGRLPKTRKRSGSNRGALPQPNEHTQESVFLTSDQKVIIVLPRRLDFEDNYETTVSHFHVLRKATRTGRRVKEVAFDSIQYISPAAALVLASEVDCWNQIVGGRLRAQTRRWDPDVRRLLIEMGYFELLKLRRPKETPPHKNTSFVKFFKGERGDRNPGALAKKLRVEIEKIVGGDIMREFLFEALSEAITNAIHHAYPQGRKNRLQGWWMSAAYDRETSTLSVTFYDQGEGIPKTLPNSDLFEYIMDLFSAWSDAEKIEAAMETGRSATYKKERGKGLQNFIKFSSHHREGSLSIYSLRGNYRVDWKQEGGDVIETTKLRNFANSINGTLVEWTVKLT